MQYPIQRQELIQFSLKKSPKMFGQFNPHHVLLLRDRQTWIIDINTISWPHPSSIITPLHHQAFIRMKAFKFTQYLHPRGMFSSIQTNSKIMTSSNHCNTVSLSRDSSTLVFYSQRSKLTAYSPSDHKIIWQNFPASSPCDPQDTPSSKFVSSNDYLSWPIQILPSAL